MRIARHEARHAAAAHLLGRTVTAAKVERHADGGVSGFVASDRMGGTVRDLFAAAIVWAVGPAGEFGAGDLPPGYRDDDPYDQIHELPAEGETDLARVRTVAETLEPSEPILADAIVIRAWRAARELMTRPEFQVARTAALELLIERGTVDGETLVTAMERAEAKRVAAIESQPWFLGAAA